MREFDPERSATSHQIANVDRYGILDGVEIDLRHADLDPKEWEMLPLGLQDFSNPRAPFIWFPGQGPLRTHKELKEKFVNEKFASHGWKWREFKKYMTPAASVNAGDKIVIDRVSVLVWDDPFLHIHDQQVKCAYIKIIRANGKTQPLEVPIRFLGRTSFQLAGASPLGVLRKITDRILSHFDFASIDDPGVHKLDEDTDNHYARSALFTLSGLLSITKEAMDKAQNLPPQDPEWQSASQFRHIIEQALLVGYYWARAEADLMMQPLALSGLEVQRAAKKAGKTSGESRRAKAERTWKAHALDLAKRLRAERPELSQHRLADEISFAWSLETPAPGHTTLTGYISELEKAGIIPARKSK